MGVGNLLKVVAWQCTGQELNPLPLDHESNALTTTPPSRLCKWKKVSWHIRSCVSFSVWFLCTCNFPCFYLCSHILLLWQKKLDIFSLWYVLMHNVKSFFHVLTENCSQKSDVKSRKRKVASHVSVILFIICAVTCWRNKDLCIYTLF